MFRAAPIGLAQLMAGATPFKIGNNVSDTYRGVIQTELGQRTAIVKDLPATELANELLAGAIGIGLGLPIPPPYLVWASAERFAGSRGPRLDDGRLLFASVDVNQPQVAMLFAGAGQPVLDRLADWPLLGRLYGFDAFVANVDRHAGNLLFSGDKEVWLIDHGYCFTGPSWRPGDFIPPDKRVRSALQEWLTPRLRDEVKERTANAAAVLEVAISTITPDALADTAHLRMLLEASDLDAVVLFLSERAQHVPKIAAETLNVGRLF